WIRCPGWWIGREGCRARPPRPSPRRSSTGSVEGRTQVADQLLVDLLQRGHVRPVRAHLARRQHLQPGGSRGAAVVDPDLEAALGARSDGRELLLAPQADVGLLWCDLEVPECLNPP